MKKALALMLALLTLLPALAACQDSAKQPVVTTEAGTQAPEETADPFDPGVPDADYKEWEFIIAAASHSNWGPESYDREEDDGDTISAAIYARNRQLEDRFNITVKSIPLGGTADQAQKFQTYAVAGEDVIDVIATGFYQSGKPLIVSGYVLPWNDVAHINLDKAWWNKSVSETLAILGNYYYIVGDVNWFTMPETSVCYFNKIVAEQNINIVGDLYATVREGKWTFDTALSISKQISNENGDGVWNAQDTYGAIQNAICGVTGFLYGANYETVIMKEDGPFMNFNTAKMRKIIEFVVEYCNENNTSYTEAFNTTPESQGIPIFFDNRALFYYDLLMHAETFRSYESDFGIIPYPKYDEKQKNYVSYANQWGLACGLPCTASDIDRTGAILESMCALSRKLIVPAYYERTLMGKIKRDDESEEMLDIIFSNVLYDFGICYCTDLSYIITMNMVQKNSTNVTSWYRKLEKPMTKNYQDLYDYVKTQLEKGE